MRFTRLYILLKPVCSGGPELAHQLIDYLQKKGKEAYVVYFNEKGVIEDCPIPEPYKKYNVKIANRIIDSEENILVLPETFYEYARKYKKIRIACWWMSVDNFIKSDLRQQPIKWYKEKSLFQNFRKIMHVALWHLPIQRFNIIQYLRDNQNRVIHLYQSEYAKQYIISNQLPNYYPLCDYINPALFPNKPINRADKKDVIVYNPAKGLEFTIQLIQLLPEYKFIALRGMNRDELNAAFNQAKLYIDFGNFPGKDRMPREAAVHDCCIITSRFGAAAYYEDVPILDKYKYEAELSNLQIIAKAIQEVIKNYSTLIDDFKGYKEIIYKEQKQFYKEIDSLLLS